MMTLHIFNPWHDLALANGDENYQPPQSARQMADDLCTLPAWSAQEGDAVLVKDIAIARQWQKEQPLPLPLLHWTSFRAPFPNVDRISPWGWDAPTCKSIRLWAGHEISEQLCPSADELERVRRLSSRHTAVVTLSDLSGIFSSYAGKAFWCTDEEEIRKTIGQYTPALCKAPWSSSGKGLRFCKDGYNSPLDGWCRRILNTQGAVVVEPLYEKATDFAMEFFSNGKGGIRFCGYSLFGTNANGAYTGNILGTDQVLEQRITALFPDTIPTNQLTLLQQQFCEALAETIGNAYTGPFGVDMMLCRPNQSDEALRIHPCVEINLRNNMGWLAHQFTTRYLAEGTDGLFRIDYIPEEGALLANHKEQTAQHPLQLRNGRIQQGYCPLTPIGKRTQYRAAVWITPTLYSG